MLYRHRRKPAELRPGRARDGNRSVGLTTPPTRGGAGRRRRPPRGTRRARDGAGPTLRPVPWEVPRRCSAESASRLRIAHFSAHPRGRRLTTSACCRTSVGRRAFSKNSWATNQRPGSSANPHPPPPRPPPPHPPPSPVPPPPPARHHAPPQKTKKKKTKKKKKKGKGNTRGRRTDPPRPRWLTFLDFCPGVPARTRPGAGTSPPAGRVTIVLRATLSRHGRQASPARQPGVMCRPTSRPCPPVCWDPS